MREQKKKLLAAASLLYAGVSASLIEDAVERKKRVWVKTWKMRRQNLGSFRFLQQELQLEDKDAYRRYLRMDEDAFGDLVGMVRSSLVKQDTQLRDSISVEEQLAMTLRFLATGESYRSLEYQTRASLSFISNTIPTVCSVIYEKLKDEYLKFPTTHQEWRNIATNMFLRWQFPNCIGALDGKHVAFRASKTDGALYYNYKGFNSIVLLAMCDADYKFIFVGAGCNGRVSDAGVLNRCSLRDFLIQAHNFLPPDEIVGNNRLLPYVVIGDDAFALEKHVMKPFPYASQEKEKKIFNLRLSHARQAIEHSFGILSNRFRVLMTTIHLRPEKVKQIILCCCVLHNYLISKNVNYIDSVELAPNSVSNPSRHNPRNSSKLASNTRNEFAKYFCEEGKLPWQDSYI